MEATIRVTVPDSKQTVYDQLKAVEMYLDDLVWLTDPKIKWHKTGFELRLAGALAQRLEHAFKSVPALQVFKFSIVEEHKQTNVPERYPSKATVVDTPPDQRAQAPAVSGSFRASAQKRKAEDNLRGEDNGGACDKPA
jgi:hypothetical protein